MHLHSEIISLLIEEKIKIMRISKQICFKMNKSFHKYRKG